MPEITEAELLEMKAYAMTMQPDELKAIRKSLDLTQEELGAALGVSRKFINDLEAGRVPIDRRAALAALQMRWHDFIRRQRLMMLNNLEGLEAGAYTITRHEGDAVRDITAELIETYRRDIAKIEQILAEAGEPLEREP